jgi:hypothetical protein
MKRFVLIFYFLAFGFCLQAQEYSWAYLTAKDRLFTPKFERQDSLLVYKGTNNRLQQIFKKYHIYEFKKTAKNVFKKDLKRTFFVVSNSDNLLQDLLELPNSPFFKGSIIPETDKKIYEPNDYGITSTIGDNLGLPLYLDYYDVLEVPKAWYYTTGRRETILGISDGSVDTVDLDFKGKTKIIRKSHLANGHGINVSATAAAQGDNGHGFVGVCYDCSIYGTSYGYFKELEPLVELSNLGASVINCSWGHTVPYQSAQEAVNKITKNGTILVAIAHNQKWVKTKNKGQLFYYPASYDKVISVATVMHRYKNPLDNILLSKNNKYYAANIRGYLGRTAGFKDNDTLNEPYIYPISIRTLNPAVDILGPGVGLVRYGEYVLHKKIDYSQYGATSGIAPLVTGTVGLMKSLQPCLTFEEVDAILKITSKNIDSIAANKPYYGYYGAGMLNTGKAVALVYKLATPSEVAFIENQHFTRWTFPLQAVSKKVIIQNQVFEDKAMVDIVAKNQIVISKNTVLKPGKTGKINLKINPDLTRRCNLYLREGFPNNKYYYPKD